MKRATLHVSLVLENETISNDEELRKEIARRVYVYWSDTLIRTIAEEPAVVKVDATEPLTKKRSVVRGRVELVLLSKEELESALTNDTQRMRLLKELKEEVSSDEATPL